jgi:hypothetical protein
MLFRREKPASQPEKCGTDSPILEHYERQRLGERSRIHLRIDGDGSGILLVNASRVMHLNPTAAFMAKLALREVKRNRRRAARKVPHLKHQARTTTRNRDNRPAAPGRSLPVHDLTGDALQRASFCTLPYGPCADLPLQQRLHALL